AWTRGCGDLAHRTARGGDDVHLGLLGQEREHSARGERFVVGVGEELQHYGSGSFLLFSHIRLLGSGYPRLARATALPRSFLSRMTFRIRTAQGVTSTHSSSRANSSDSFNESFRAGGSFSIVSADGARMFVSFFSRVMLTSMSSPRVFSPLTCPSYPS